MGIRRTHSRLKPPGPHGGIKNVHEIVIVIYENSLINGLLMANLLYFSYESNQFSLRYALNFFPELLVLCLFFPFFDYFNRLVSNRETLSSVSTFTEQYGCIQTIALG